MNRAVVGVCAGVHVFGVGAGGGVRGLGVGGVYVSVAFHEVCTLRMPNPRDR